MENVLIGIVGADIGGHVTHQAEFHFVANIEVRGILPYAAAGRVIDFLYLLGKRRDTFLCRYRDLALTCCIQHDKGAGVRVCSKGTLCNQVVALRHIGKRLPRICVVGAQPGRLFIDLISKCPDLIAIVCHAADIRNDFAVRYTGSAVRICFLTAHSLQYSTVFLIHGVCVVPTLVRVLTFCPVTAITFETGRKVEQTVRRIL